MPPPRRAARASNALSPRIGSQNRAVRAAACKDHHLTPIVKTSLSEYNRNVASPHYNTYVVSTNSQELRVWLRKKGCGFESHKGGSGHTTVVLGGKKTQLPMHGANKELGKGLVAKINKDLGLK